MVGESNIAVGGFTTHTAFNATGLTVIADSPAVISVTNSAPAAGWTDSSGGTLSFYPILYNSNIGPDSISMGISSGNCAAVFLGYGNDGPGAVYNAKVHNITASTSLPATSPCSGIYFGSYNTAIPKSVGIDITNNTLSGFWFGLRFDASPVTYDDLTISDNKLSGNRDPIDVPGPPPSYREYNNVTSATQTTENLRGGVTLDASGNIASPGWVSGGVNVPNSSSGAVTWSSAVAVNVITLTGNVTSSAIANGAFAGQQVCFAVTQGSSVYSIVWPSNLQGMSNPASLRILPPINARPGRRASFGKRRPGHPQQWEHISPRHSEHANDCRPGIDFGQRDRRQRRRDIGCGFIHGHGQCGAGERANIPPGIRPRLPTARRPSRTWSSSRGERGPGRRVRIQQLCRASEWKLRKDASNYLRLTDAVNSLDREVFYQNGQTAINSGAGANSVLINSSTGSGTGGFYVESGGSARP